MRYLRPQDQIEAERAEKITNAILNYETGICRQLSEAEREIFASGYYSGVVDVHEVYYDKLEIADNALESVYSNVSLINVGKGDPLDKKAKVDALETLSNALQQLHE
ncbi:hypothetical protein AB6A23_05250 [Paenibacillus tarimensis]